MRFTLSALICILATSTAIGQEFGDVSYKDLSAAIAAGNVAVIDVNGTTSYEQGHIPGAINFQADATALAEKLPKAKATLVVAYCGGPMCKAYKKAAAQATKLGYTNVKHFSAGLSGWKASGGKVATVTK